MRFNSDELLKQFGNHGFGVPGLECKVSFHCLDCEFLFSCEIGKRNDFDSTKRDSENEPAGCDFPIRNIHHKSTMRKYDFKQPSANKSWHDAQPIVFQFGENEK